MVVIFRSAGMFLELFAEGGDGRAQLAGFVESDLFLPLEFVGMLLALEFQLVAEALDRRLQLPRLIVPRRKRGLHRFLALGRKQL
jgi:hypothetical protein